jgi:hypothetical protein
MVGNSNKKSLSDAILFLDKDFLLWIVLNGNGELHRRVLRALDTRLVGWILDCPDPWRGLFAVEVCCVVCHRMHHEAGRCLHGKVVKRREAA